MKIQYRELNENEICRNLFQQFIRRQNVVKCWRREGGQWLIKDAPFIDDWSEADYQVLITCLKNTIATGGFVYGAFCGGVLKGFASVEAALFGSNGEYLDLTSLHVSEDMRGKGIGKTLFLEAGRWAKEAGNCISPAIRLWRRRPSIRLWDVWRHRNITNSMWRQSPLTVSWNIGYNAS